MSATLASRGAASLGVEVEETGVRACARDGAARASSCPTPGSPTRIEVRPVAASAAEAGRRRAKGRRRGCAGSRRASRRRTSRRIASASTSAAIASAITPIAGTAVTSLRSATGLRRLRRSSMSIVPSGRISVLMGFIATRTTSGSPVVMPPFEAAGAVGARGARCRCARGRARVSISSCTSAPVRARRLEAEADLHALHGGNRQHRRAQAAVELAIPAHVRAEPHGEAVDDHFADAAEGVAVAPWPRRCARSSLPRRRRRACASGDASAAALMSAGSRPGARGVDAAEVHEVRRRR